MCKIFATRNMHMPNLPKIGGSLDQILVKEIFLESADDADHKNILVQKIWPNFVLVVFWVTFLVKPTLKNPCRTLSTRPNVQEYMRKFFPKPQNMRKICANMRKYAQIPENRKYAQNMRKYAQICANMCSAYFPPDHCFWAHCSTNMIHLQWRARSSLGFWGWFHCLAHSPVALTMVGTSLDVLCFLLPWFHHPLPSAFRPLLCSWWDPSP